MACRRRAAAQLGIILGVMAMVFSSQLFLYCFMPVFFSMYYFIDDRRKNWLILAASLLFYSVGAGSTVLVLLASIWINQYLAVRIEAATPQRGRQLLAIGVTPIGISFFTFQAISYLIDVYRREVSPAVGYGEFAVYHSLFPQLVAGPIVRYREISR
jgi:alginate O-acetyltransferase complex protein AlgI